MFASVASSPSYGAIAQSARRKFSASSSISGAADLRSNVSYRSLNFRAASSRTAVLCVSTAADVPTVSETKTNFFKSHKTPIPSIYGAVLEELLVQQHVTRYKRSYRYDPLFALGFVTVYDRLMEGYPNEDDKSAIFKAYVEALNEDPVKYRADAANLEEWARGQSPNSLVDFKSRDGEVEGVLKDIAERAGSKGNFSYSRFFAVGLLRLLELTNSAEPTILDKLCTALNVNKKSVDRDLDVSIEICCRSLFKRRSC